MKKVYKGDFGGARLLIRCINSVYGNGDNYAIYHPTDNKLLSLPEETFEEALPKVVARRILEQLSEKEFECPGNYDYMDGLGHFLSRTGNCEPFDDGADGHCRGEDMETLILKRYEDANADKDPFIRTMHLNVTEII
ncbi:hypothetical protein TSTA_015660 [Talaromyces stipitatus ATCC 10500]|uniref:Beta-ketoacyl synthase-like N-terminal domain-containing protein n=1 Tax=Talaromyces stipitatus (strain ATCC 10500 / CBS 375.48 / QM 6759 / NRRL 1006) TaxID=441959 RepID=B8ME54_TALSN|nr:uncharacterized protein TSTA_015660 [Talaromyces stipitatus ATCC 10500]EED16481.1 hypothetical protein TSTA_015660 [Talaromyces stipitatus ATCC 10500]